MVHGYAPDVIDHINGDGTDNRIANLREADFISNARNSARSSSNTSGVTGVSWHKETRKWRAYLTINASQIYLGLFESKGEAIHARISAQEDHGFHPNHGRGPKERNAA